MCAASCCDSYWLRQLHVMLGPAMRFLNLLPLPKETVFGTYVLDETAASADSQVSAEKAGSAQF